MESPPTGGPTPPETETAPDACGGLATAAAMPKGPKQQPPEPEWIGDGEGTSPAGERGGGRNGQGDGGRRGAWVLRMCAGGRGRAHGAVPEPREASRSIWHRGRDERTGAGTRSDGTARVLALSSDRVCGQGLLWYLCDVLCVWNEGNKKGLEVTLREIIDTKDYSNFTFGLF